MDTYKCSECKKIFQSNELQLEKMLDNMHISTPGVDVENGIPKCPHCGHLAFFGFEVVE
jgi:DNA-directed RNA polymerase subunit RPC12/RpoP